MVRRHKGFTLIELLVVIAIIAILAAMLFPVFARARESARKIQCLANVKNIATAIQMYLSDYEALSPREHRPEVLAYFDARGPGPQPALGHCQYGLVNANPYLRWPVVLDDYIKNREVWGCPSARVTGGATFVIPTPDWFGYWQQHAGEWPIGRTGPCATAWPAGWGGAVTDSLVQGLAAEVDQVNTFFYGLRASSGYDDGLNPGSVADPSHHVVVCDAGVPNDDFLSPGVLAFPEVCNMECAVPGLQYCCSADWQNPPDQSAAYLDCLFIHAPGDGSMRSPSARAAYSRHLGGVNIGFLDGHAAWMPSEAVLAAYAKGELEGPRPRGPHSAFDGCPFTAEHPGVPVLY
jgi:prepilin-type N-terminal cleavage/methylation domain-containing protein/prepilin-type processing-associated H-X9-DG protein